MASDYLMGCALRSTRFADANLYNNGAKRAIKQRVRMQPATYADIQQVLTQEHSLTDAAEAHGTLAGSLCTAPVYRFEDWVREILPVEAVQPRSAATLRGL